MLDDGSIPPKTIARMHPRDIFKGTRSFLEIGPEGLHMTELIVATWVFVEARWNDAGKRLI